MSEYENVSKDKKVQSLLLEISCLISDIKESPDGRVRDIVKLLPYSCLVVSEDSTVLEFRPADKDTFGNETLVGRKLINVFPSTHKELIQSMIKETFTTKQSIQREIELIRENQVNFFEVFSFYLSDSEIIVFYKDITEHKKKEDIEKRELEKLRQLDEVRKNLITNVTHELKTPIMSIANSAELLQTIFTKSLSKDANELIEIIERGTNRLSDLVNKLLDVSRIEFSKYELNLTKVDLSQLAKECSENMRINLKRRRINFILNIQPELYIMVDKGKIEQVITNLLSNAIKNTPPHGTIELSLYRKNQQAVLTVKDDGVGLTKKERKKIFSMFAKLNRSGKGFEFLNIKGSGLGLYLSKQIIEMHEGNISAESDGRFKGSKFTVKIPLSSVTQILNLL